MKKYIFALILLCTASIAQAARIVRIIEEPAYEYGYVSPYHRVRYYPRPVIKRTVYVQQPRRTVYIQPRQVVYRRPVYVTRRENCGSAVAAGLVGLGFGTLLGSALAQ
jgi:hypothetical protein